MFKKLANLKNIYKPDSIIDIGAHHGVWTKNMLNIYPDLSYYLFEGINYQELREFDNNSKINIWNVLLNNKEEEIDWYQEKNTGDSFFQEKSKYFINTKPIKRITTTLDIIIGKENILNESKNIFIKIDCQGAEIPILKGAQSLLNRTDFILLEIPLFGQYNVGVCNFTQHIEFMKSINFVVLDIIDNHYINDFNMQVDILFVNINSDFYKNFKKQPIIHSIMLTDFQREHVINYIKNKKKLNPNFKVIDIGGSAEYTNWSHSVIDFIVDINQPNINNSHIKYFQLNMNFENDFKELFDYVTINGKFDFCICSHIIEDISLPQVLLNNLKNIAKEGFIGIPSKYRELSRIEGNYLGYIHHRWIYSIKNNELIGYPKVNFIEYEKKLTDIGLSENELSDLSFFWKNDVKYSIINNNYMGPTKSKLIEYYDELIYDDLDILRNSNSSYYHIEYVKQYQNINGDFIKVLMLIDNFLNDLKYMDKIGFIPFDITDKRNIFGKSDLIMLFINKQHEFNTTVQEKLY